MGKATRTSPPFRLAQLLEHETERAVSVTLVWHLLSQCVPGKLLELLTVVPVFHSGASGRFMTLGEMWTWADYPGDHVACLISLGF